MSAVMNAILSQVISPCGKYLLSGDNKGMIFIYCIEDAIKPYPPLLINAFMVKPMLQIHAMISTQDYLLVANESCIEFYDWYEVINLKHIKPVWNINLQNKIEKVDALCMAYNRFFELLCVGGDDHSVQIYDIKNGQQVMRFNRAHHNFIFCIGNERDDIVTGGKDGFVNKFDLRIGTCTATLKPYCNNLTSRKHGKWIGAIDLQLPWMLCGGAPSLTLWDYRNCSVARTYQVDDTAIYVAKIHNSNVLAGGRSTHFYNWEKFGCKLEKLESSSTCVYTAVLQNHPCKFLSYSGSSPVIDISRDFLFRNNSVNLPHIESPQNY